MLQMVLSQALIRAERVQPSFVGRLTLLSATWGYARWQAYRGKRRYRATIDALSALDDRTLHDIGIHRSEIESYASVGGVGRVPNRFEINDHNSRG